MWARILLGSESKTEADDVEGLLGIAEIDFGLLGNRLAVFRIPLKENPPL